MFSYAFAITARFKFRRQRNHIRNPMARCHQIPFRRPCHFVPPDIAVKSFFYFRAAKKSSRTARLRKRTTIARQRHRTAKVQFLFECQLQFFVSRCSHHDVHWIFQHPQNHRAGRDANPDVVFDNMPFALVPNRGHLERAIEPGFPQPGLQRIEQLTRQSIFIFFVPFDESAKGCARYNPQVSIERALVFLGSLLQE